MTVKENLKQYKWLSSEIYHLQTVISKEKLEENKEFFRNKKEELVKMKDEILKCIFSINDSYMRQLFTLRFIDGLSYAAIAARFNTTPDSVRVSVDKYIKRNLGNH